MEQELKRKRVTKPVRVEDEWHHTLKLEAAQQRTSMSKLLEKIFSSYFFPLTDRDLK